MGYMDEIDVVGGLAALEMVLSDLGFDVRARLRRHRRAAGAARAEDAPRRPGDGLA